MSEAPYCPPTDGAYTLFLVYELNYMVGCCKKRDNDFRETKFHFSVAVQAEGGAALLHVDPGSFHHLLSVFQPVARGKGRRGGGAIFLQGNDVEVSALAII